MIHSKVNKICVSVDYTEYVCNLWVYINLVYNSVDLFLI